MKIIVPYVEIHPLVKKWLDQYQPYYVKMEDDNSYWRLMVDIWERGEPVTIIEHDIMPWPNAIAELESCPYPWCSNSYKMRGGYGIHHAFGCTKFTTDFMRSLPNIWSAVDTTMWNTLDAQLCEIAKTQGITPHPHRPPVIHLKGLV